MTDKRVKVEIVPIGSVVPIQRGYKFELGEPISFTISDPTTEITPENIDSIKWEFGGQDTVFGDQTVERKFFDPGTVYVRVSGRAMIGETEEGNEIWHAFSGTTELYNGPSVLADFSFSPERPNVSETVIFDGGGSSATLEAIDGYTWTCVASNGGVCPSDFPNEQKKFAVAFDAAGSYQIALTVTSTDGGIATEEDVLVVGSPDQKVSAKIIVTPTRPNVDDTVVFDGGNSEVAFGEIGSFSWECSATLGGVCPVDWGTSASQKKFATTFESAGSYHVTLTVTSDDGTVATDEDVVVVENPAGGSGVLTPVLEFLVEGQAASGARVLLDRGTEISVQASASLDEEGGKDFEESWTLNGKTSSATEIASVLKTKLGTFNVGLKIKSNLTGEVASTSGEVVIKNKDPEVASLVATLLSNPPSHVKVIASATDPDTTDPLSQYRFEVLHWGEVVAVQPNPQPEAVFDLSKFEGPQEFIFRVTVVDVDDATAEYETTQSFDLPTPISQNTAPTASILVQPKTTGDVRTNFYFSAVADDADGDSLDYEWKFSDGKIRTGQMISQSFLFAGNYSVTLTVSDGLEEAKATASVTVTEPPTDN